MKTKNFLKSLLAVTAILIYSCGSDSDSDGNDVNGNLDPTITSIVVTASSTSVEVGNEVTFTVTGNAQTDLTSQSTILVNNVAITGNSYTPTTPGTFTVKAEYEQITSTNLFLEVLAGPIVALRVESASTNLKVGDTADFVVIGTDDLGNDYTITNDATISINGTAITGSSFMVTEMGDITAMATKDAVTSDAITLPVTDETAPGSFTKKALIEDYTGTWCGWCPRVSYAIELVENETDKVYAVAAHNGDPMQNSYSLALDNVYVTTGYPTAILNRDQEWTFPEPSNVAQATNLATGTTTSGISLNSILKGDQLQVYVSTAFSQSTTGAKLVVMLLEDGIIASQANYTSYYGGVSPLSQFEHNHTLRHALTDVFGDPISDTSANSKTNHVFNITVPIIVNNLDKMSLVALIVDANDKVINAAGEKVGADHDFQ